MFLKSAFVKLVVLSLLITTACKSKIEKDAKQNQPKPAVSVAVFVVSESPLEQDLEASGTLMAEEEVLLKPEITGRITQLNFTEGASVQKGQLLVKLYDTDLKAQIKKLEAQKEIARNNYKRQEELLKINGISQQDFDLSLNQLNNINADIDLLKAQLDKTEIRAPFSGKVGLKSVSVGAYVSAGTAIATLQQTNTLKLDFSIPEKYESFIKKGQNINFTIDGNQLEFAATVYALEPYINLTTRDLKLRARFVNSKNLLPGTFAKVKVALEAIPNALLIPSEAIIPEARNKKVIIAKQGKAVFQIVKTGVRTAQGVQIIEGLQQGDTLVVTGLMQLKPDAEIQINAVKH